MSLPGRGAAPKPAPRFSSAIGQGRQRGNQCLVAVGEKAREHRMIGEAQWQSQLTHCVRTRELLTVNLVDDDLRVLLEVAVIGETNHYGENGGGRQCQQDAEKAE